MPSRPSWLAMSATAWPGAAPLPMRRHLFQDLSLPSQPRDHRSRPLVEILGDGGSGRQPRRSDRLEDISGVVEERLPANIVDELELRGVTGGRAVENATDLLIDAADGLRASPTRSSSWRPSNMPPLRPSKG